MVRIDDSGNDVKCWLTYPDEIETLAREAREDDWERRIAVLLMGKIGLRASGVPTARPQGLTYNDEGDYWQLEVKGKNTKTGEKATRDAYVPTEVKRELENYAKERDITPSDPYVDVSPPMGT
jgi:dipeptidase